MSPRLPLAQSASSKLVRVIIDDLRRALKSRMAGQYAKPRSSDWETVDGTKMASYRGDAVNAAAPDPARRIADRALLVHGPVATGSGLSNLILAPEVAARLLASLAPLLVVCRHRSDPLARLLDADGRLGSAALTLVDDRLDPDARDLVGRQDVARHVGAGHP